MTFFSNRKQTIQYTFMRVLIPSLAVTLIVVALLVVLYEKHSAQNKLLISQKSFLSLLDQILPDDIGNFDSTSAEKILKAIALNKNIQFIELSDGSGKTIATVGKIDSMQAAPESKIIKKSTGSGEEKTAGLVRYQFAPVNYQKTVVVEMIKTVFLLVILLIVITIVMLRVYRRDIHAPIRRIMDALIENAKGENTVLIDWKSDDEFGTLAAAFNAMQRSLNKNQRFLVESALRYQDLYNKTPALLFSMDTNGVITDASVYFLQKLGYRKASLIGLTLSEMVCDNFPGKGNEVPDRLVQGGRLANFQTCIRTNTGEKMDVLINTISLRPDSDDETVVTSLCVMTDISKQVHAQDTVFRQANYDVVTDLPNRFFFSTRFRSLLDTALRVGSSVSVIFIDLDRFKWVNDTFGHSVGDALLAEAGTRIKDAVDMKSLVCRFGGDEFIVAVHKSREEVLKSKVAENILRTLADPFRILQHEIHLSASIGISSFPSDGETPDELIGAADTAMYHAKDRGGNACEYYEGDMHERMEKQLHLDSVLRTGIQEERFSLVFQPIVDLNSKSSELFEVLLRFSHPDFPNISPAEFIPLAETTGLIRPIGQFVIRNALLHLHALDNQGDKRYSLTINLSPRQLQDDTFVAFLEDQLQYFKISPQRIILEITENSLMENNIRSEKILEQIRQVGCLIAIDDFGTGFSSLSYLRRFAVDILKIDQAFIQRVPTDIADSNLIRGIINMSRELGIAVIAEGVEKKTQYDFLIESGCDMGQGFYFSKPVKPEDIYSNKIHF
ncbi:MAG TPA: EAL domain-containing protein [Gammaproteobacteria bacterium]|nr:EAL domain-containing protein [Gammaproteobacteria bacterium]